MERTLNQVAPIALFVYNRLDHTERTVEALKKNDLAKHSPLIIFSDGPKANEEGKVQALRSYLRSIEGFKTVKVIENKINRGLAASIISGVTSIVKEYGKIIVVEDDLVTSPYFLKYLNAGLDFYENNQDVISIHGYNYPINRHFNETFFLKGADCWGWATWKRGWDLFEEDAQILYDKLEESGRVKDFDFNHSFPYMRMLKNQIEGKVNSWAIRWYASAFLKDKLTLYPGSTLVNNVGFDNSGTHCSDANPKLFYSDFLNKPTIVSSIPVTEDIKAKKLFASHFRKIQKDEMGWKKYLKVKIKRIIPKSILSKTSRK